MNGFIRKDSRGEFFVDRLQRFPSLVIDEIILAELQGFLDRHFTLGEKGRLLDLGAGTRPYAPVYSAYFSEHYGLDAPGCLHGDGGTDVLGSAENLPFADQVFDCIVCTEVLEHLPSPELALRECSRILKPSGLLFLSTPFLNPLHEIPADYFRFTPFALREMGQRNGLALMSLAEKGGLGGFSLLFFLYLTLLAGLKVERWTGIPVFSHRNPLLWLVFFLSQLVYLYLWRRQGKCMQGNLADVSSWSQTLSPVTLGYVAIFCKPTLFGDFSC